mmetsp:Transcript_5719/g.12069  ORF Transcript_5719/g.12069 Transcript_5719/m.12069 type:complete len:201 (-) Transcript_5719:432-1034(-)
MLRRTRDPGEKRLPYRVDPLVGKIRHLHVRPNLDRLRRQPPPDVGHEVVAQSLGYLQMVERVVLSARVGLHRQLERVVGVSVLFVEGPSHLFVQLVEVEPPGVGQVAEDRVDPLGFVVAVFALGNVLGAHPTFGEVDVAFFFVDAEDHDHFVSVHAEELVDGTDATSGEFRKEDHALYVVVFEEGDVGSHLGDVPDVHHD